MTNQQLSSQSLGRPASAVVGGLPIRRVLFATAEDRGATVLRLVLAVVMFPHGAQKVLGWFGGHGIEGTMDYFTGVMGIPSLLAALVLVAEFLGPLALAAGLLTRVAAAGIGAVMAGAVAMVHLPHGFFMNWDGSAAGEGFEYHLLALGMAVALVIRGGGSFSLDARIARGTAGPGRRAS